jgi:hypothetical protein
LSPQQTSPGTPGDGGTPGLLHSAGAVSPPLLGGADLDPTAPPVPQGIAADPRAEEVQRAHDRELRAVYIARGVIRPAPDEN